MYNTAVSCPTTHFPISGSCHGEIAGQTGRAAVMSSIMADDINGWRCFFDNKSPATARVSARVHCLKKVIP